MRSFQEETGDIEGIFAIMKNDLDPCHGVIAASPAAMSMGDQFDDILFVPPNGIGRRTVCEFVLAF
jgi:hypothetical protein